MAFLSQARQQQQRVVQQLSLSVLSSSCLLWRQREAAAERTGPWSERSLQPTWTTCDERIRPNECSVWLNTSANHRCCKSTAIHTQIHKYVNEHTHTYAHAHTHPHTQTHKHHTNTQTHTHKHTHTQTHTHTHTHEPNTPPMDRRCSLPQLTLLTLG